MLFAGERRLSMRIEHKNFYANIVKSEGGISYYVIQSRGNDEVIYCGQARTQRAAVEAATNYLDDLSSEYYEQKLAS